MKFVTGFIVALAMATPALAQHVHDQGPPGAPQRGGRPQTPPIDVPWNDAHSGRHRRSRRARAQGVAAPRRVGRHQDGRRHGAQVAGSSIRNGTTKAGVVLVIHDIRGMADLAARRRRSARAGRLHRHRAGLSVRQGTERRRHRIARHRRRPGDSGADAGRGRRRASTRRWSTARRCRRRTARPASSASAGAARAASATRPRSRS